MKLDRFDRVAALALVGWYLMLPPVDSYGRIQ
jgi:hypothetical protein